MLLSSLKKDEALFHLPIYILFSSAFKLAKSSFAAKSDVPTPATRFKSAFATQIDKSNLVIIFPLERYSD